MTVGTACRFTLAGTRSGHSRRHAVDLDCARIRNVGMIYITDDVYSPNPWDALASYFTTESADLLRVP